jgi:hypothetical protein
MANILDDIIPSISKTLAPVTNSVNQFLENPGQSLNNLPDGASKKAAQKQLVGKTIPGKDFRVILSALHPDDIFKDNNILTPLKDLKGVLFPYTPTVTFTQAVNYMDLQLVHSNTDYSAYTRTPSVTIGINGKFTVQNQTEGLYALACLHFFRTVSKSYFGIIDAQSNKAGLPPPVLVLDGYGDYIFNNLKVILKSHSWTFDDSADGVIVKATKGYARIPALFTINTELTVVQTPNRMRTKFSFDKFASGDLMQSGAGWI